MSAVRITSSNYAGLVMASEKPVLLDFWASWCGPCRMVSPVVDEIGRGAGRPARRQGQCGRRTRACLCLQHKQYTDPCRPERRQSGQPGDGRETQIEHSVPGQITNFVLLSPFQIQTCGAEEDGVRESAAIFLCSGLSTNHIQKMGVVIAKGASTARTARLTTPAMYYIIFIL